MPLCTLHLVSLHSTVSDFLSALKSSPIKPLVTSRVIRWIILPTKISTEHLLARNVRWDLLIILPGAEPLPDELTKLVQHNWSVTAGVPSRLTQDFSKKNEKILHPDPSTLPKASEKNRKKTTSSSQSLELSSELEAWIQDFMKSGSATSHGAVSMFNLLAFNPGMKSEYLKYGKAFAESIGSDHGGNAKIVGNVTHIDGVAKSTEQASAVGKDGGEISEWDEIALAHYPSILHFRDMLSSEAYQDVNKRHRVPSLKDTCILMTSEIAIEELEKGRSGQVAKL